MSKLKLMKKAYTRQKSNARQRGIKWQFTFEEWQLKWEESGKWEQRGRKKHQYVMCRYNDEGAYSYYNTKIDTANNNNYENLHHRYKNHTYRTYTKVQDRRGRPNDCGKSVTVNGITYPTKVKAAIALGVPNSTFKYRYKNGYYD